jgi:hypothetical protein
MKSEQHIIYTWGTVLVQNTLFSKMLHVENHYLFSKMVHVENHYDIKYIIHCNFNAKHFEKYKNF